MSKRLLQLMRANARETAAPAIRLDASGDGPATVYLYDVIDSYWGANAAELSKALAAVRGRDVALRINSPGGDVFEAVAMASAIAAHDGTVTAHIDGLAASSATRVALACSAVQIADSGMFMIHHAWTWAWGNAAELRTSADLLDKVDGQIANDYTRKTGASLDQVTAWMDAETWFTAQEALDAQFVDAITATTQAADKATSAANSARRWDLSAYANAPKPPQPPQDLTADLQRQHARNAARLRLLSTV
ncbi:MAG: hypothetical protein RIQ53_4163 [Pseudomonadota bacterium]|jgi:ATP-dependent Clp protease protease subunit